MATTTAAAKRHKLHHHQEEEDDEQQPLIPDLPDHIAQLCLSSINNPSLLFRVCHSWRRIIYSPSFPPFLSLYAILSSHSSHSTAGAGDSVQFHTFDLISQTWQTLPPPPSYSPLLLRHPSFLSRNLSIQSISLAGNLILLAATTHNLSPALSRPFIFHPISRRWSLGPPLPTPRRWCALGSSRGAVYVASGFGSHFSGHVARSLQKWELTAELAAAGGGSGSGSGGGEWEQKAELKHGRFSREAIDAVGWRGKICMVNMTKEGAVYDVEEDTWKEMPEGMLSGWSGPVAAMAEEVMYVVDEVKGVVRKYSAEEDSWEEVFESERLIGAEQLVAEKGKLCVVSAAGISVVDVAAAPPRVWVVELPDGFEAVAVHILPRMPVTDFSVKA